MITKMFWLPERPATEDISGEWEEEHEGEQEAKDTIEPCRCTSRRSLADLINEIIAKYERTYDYHDLPSTLQIYLP